MCIMEKRWVLDKLGSGVSCCAAGHEFDVTESTICTKVSLNRNTRKTRLCINQLMKLVSRGSQEPNPVFRLWAKVQCLLGQCSPNFTERNYCEQ